MASKTDPNLLASLIGVPAESKSTAWKQFVVPTAATAPPLVPAQTTPADPAATNGGDARLSQLLQRINQLTAAPTEGPKAPPPSADTARLGASETQNWSKKNVSPVGVVTFPVAPAEKKADLVTDDFLPQEPLTLREANLNDTEVESLALKFLLSKGEATGREIADQLKLPFALLSELYWQLKQDQLVVYRGSAPMNDYVYQLTDLGRERGRRYAEHCSYFGSAPVSLTDYILSVSAQSLTKQHPTRDDLEKAFDDLLISARMMTRLGPAINSGRGMFLYGAAGNGKTSIAERVTRAFGQYIWIPRAIGVDGEIIRLFDPSSHEECPPDSNTGIWSTSKIDQRWVRVRRPTIVVGGELTMDNLEVTLNHSTGISEAPVQLKSNCGTLVIDDFGRQKMGIDQLLNRWIVPLEKRYDYLNLPNGKKIQVPFDQLIVFSTNLQPKDLCDDAFLRRIPYKIEVIDPTEDEFRKLFELICGKMGIAFNAESLDYLVTTHYKQAGRKFRCCQPRDLLLQVRNMCLFEKKPPELRRDYLDYAVENYFSIM